MNLSARNKFITEICKPLQRDLFALRVERRAAKINIYILYDVSNAFKTPSLSRVNVLLLFEETSLIFIRMLKACHQWNFNQNSF